MTATVDLSPSLGSTAPGSVKKCKGINAASLRHCLTGLTSSRRGVVNRGAYHLHGKPGKFQLENQMVHIIPFGVLLKLCASGQSNGFLLLLLGFTADVHTFCMLSIIC